MNETQVNEYRHTHNITVGQTDGELDVPNPVEKLYDVDYLADSLLKVLEQEGLHKLIPVQAQGWPMILLRDRDFVGIVETRTGLPLTYLVPAIVFVKASLAAKNGPIALILAANSELAHQIDKQASKFKSLDINFATLTQTSDLENGLQIIITTLEALDPMLKSRKTNMNNVAYLVIDGVDDMLKNGSGELIEKIIGQTQRDCQILFWSCTRSDGVEKLANKYLPNRFNMTIGSPPTNREKAKLVSEEGMAQLKESHSPDMSMEELEKYSRAYNILVNGKNVPKPIERFEDFGFPVDVLRGADLASSPTPIESLVWAMALKGRDFIGIGETVPGKTILFLLPAIIHLKHQPGGAEDDGPIALILAATLEHAAQIQEAASKFDVKIACLGGVPKGPQIADLQKGSELVIATPDVLPYMLRRKYINLSKVTYLVFDEADVIFDKGLVKHVETLLGKTRRDCQLIYWSATDSKDVSSFFKDYMYDPYEVTFLDTENMEANQTIYQKVEIVDEDQKFSKLVELLRKIMVDRSRILIFIEKENVCDQVHFDLRMNGWPAVNICGKICGEDKSVEERKDVLRQFKDCTSRIMITTDGAAASHLGKEINILHIINYDFPSTLDIYKQRIKRAGAKGKSYTFFTKDDAAFATELVSSLKNDSQEVSQELLKYVRQ